MNNVFITKNHIVSSLLSFSILLGIATGNSVNGQTPEPTATPIADKQNLPLDPPEVAPQYTAPTRPLPGAERVGVDVSSQKPMSLDEVIKMTLQNSNDITIAETSVKMSEFNFKAAKGAYDPVFSSELSYLKSKTPTASSLGSVDGSTTTSSFANATTFGGLSPFLGGSYQVRFQTARDKSNSPLNSLDPQFPSALSFSYVQPLLRGLTIDNNRRNVQIAKKNLSISDAAFRQNSIEVINNVVQAYWDLTYSLRNLQVQIDAVKQARLQVESNKRQVSEGMLAPIEIVEAEAQVTNFEQGVYAAQQQVTAAENRLKSLMLPSENDPVWTQAIVPTTPVNVTPPSLSVEDALAQAKANRPELEQLKLTKEVNKINKDYLRDQTRPRIDLTAGFTTNGLSGSVLNNAGGGVFSSFDPLIARINELSILSNLPPVQFGTGSSEVPPGLVGNYGKSLSNMFSMNHPTYQVGVKIELPFGNRTAKANLGYALAEETQINAQIARADQMVKTEVQNAIQAIKTAEARLNAAAASRNSSEQLYEGEKRRLDNGTSTIYLVLERQQRLVSARGQELQAQIDLNKAISNLQKAIGTTFESHNIEIKETSKVKKLELNAPAESDMDHSGILPSNPRISPTVSFRRDTADIKSGAGSGLR